MLSYYKQSKFTSRLIAAFLFAGLAAVISWRFEYNLLQVLGGTLAITILAEVFFFHIRFFLVSVLSLIQSAIVLTTALVVYNVLINYNANSGMGLAMATGMVIVGFSGILLTLVGNYIFSVGRLWINVLLSFLVYNAISFPLLATGVNLSYVIQSLIALAGVVLYILVRHYFPRDKTSEFDLTAIKTQRGSSAIKARIQKEHPNLKIQDINTRVLLASNDKVAFVILPLTPEKYFSILENDAWFDSEPITGVFEYMISESQDASHNFKINKKYFIPVIYVTAKSTLKSKLTTIKVRSRRTPDRIMGNVFVVTSSGFDSLIKGYEKQKPMPAKLLKKLTPSEDDEAK